MVTIINAAAWILCIVMGALLLGDMIKTEIYFAEKDSKNDETSEAKKEVSEDGRK